MSKIKILASVALALPALSIILISCLFMVAISGIGWLLGGSTRKSNQEQPVTVAVRKTNLVYLRPKKNKKAA